MSLELTKKLQTNNEQAEEKKLVTEHVDAITDIKMLDGKLFTCLQMKAYRQRGWNCDKYRTEHLCVLTRLTHAS